MQNDQIMRRSSAGSSGNLEKLLADMALVWWFAGELGRLSVGGIGGFAGKGATVHQQRDRPGSLVTELFGPLGLS
jgi:hypothetical protein